MMELIKIIDNNGQSVVSARDLHSFLEVGRDFSTWIKQRVHKYGFVENEDYTVFTHLGENPKGGRPEIEYALTTNMAKELAMIQNNDKGRQARRYFIECERIAKSQHTTLPSIIDHILLEHRQIEDTQVKLQQQITELDEKKQRLTKARLYLTNKTAIDEWREGFIKRNGKIIHDFMSKNIASWVSAGYVKASDFRTMFVNAGCRLGNKSLHPLVKEWCDANGYIFKRGLLKRSGSDVFRVHIFKTNPKGGVI